MITEADVREALRRADEEAAASKRRCQATLGGEQCDRLRSHGPYCTGHAGQVNRHGRITHVRLRAYGKGVQQCKVPGCTRRAIALFLCNAHYMRHLRCGDARATVPLRKRSDQHED